MRRSGWLALPLLLAGCAQGFQVDGARLMERVKLQVDSGPRVPGSPGHRKVKEWIVAELARLGGRVEEQAFIDTTLGRPLPLVNLIGRFGPESGARVVLAAHWDSRAFADLDPDLARRGEPVPGANDGASGVAVLLEIAELMSKRAPKVGVELVFFDGEDQGLAHDASGFCLGSRHYAARVRPGEVVAAFVFDMVGDRDLSIHPEVNSARQASNLVALVLEAARATGARHFHPEPLFDLYDDHRPLLEAGVPAVVVIDFEYPAWHTTADRPDQVSAESLAEVATVAAWIVYQGPFRAR